jgi:hypothetical protein
MDHNRLEVEGTHGQPSYQHKPTPSIETKTVVKVVIGVIVITPPYARMTSMKTLPIGLVKRTLDDAKHSTLRVDD